ncbi:MAG: hypothetical protein ACLQDV_12485 [Candidatus Binataceae bacterium]
MAQAPKVMIIAVSIRARRMTTFIHESPKGVKIPPYGIIKPA